MLEQEYSNDSDACYTYIDSMTSESIPLTPFMMKEWACALVSFSILSCTKNWYIITVWWDGNYPSPATHSNIWSCKPQVLSLYTLSSSWICYCIVQHPWQTWQSCSYLPNHFGHGIYGSPTVATPCNSTTSSHSLIHLFHAFTSSQHAFKAILIPFIHGNTSWHQKHMFTWR